MALYATRNLVGPHGENVEANTLIPATWPDASPFVAECITYGWIVSADDPPQTPEPVHVPGPAATNVGGNGHRAGTAKKEA